MNEYRWFVRSRPWDDSVDLLLRSGDRIGKAEITMEPHERGLIVEPTLTIRHDEAQQLINELWQAGYRPKDGTGSVAHAEAQKAHLEDMRRLVFDPVVSGTSASREGTE